MADKKNLCAQIDIALHNRVTEEKDRLEMTTSQYIASLLTEYYKMKDENGGINMTGSRTMAFQIPEELFQRIKTHLARETARTGVKLTQRDFVLQIRKVRVSDSGQFSLCKARPFCCLHHVTSFSKKKKRGRRTHLKQMRPPAPFLFFVDGGEHDTNVRKNSFYRG